MRSDLAPSKAVAIHAIRIREAVRTAARKPMEYSAARRLGLVLLAGGYSFAGCLVLLELTRGGAGFDAYAYWSLDLDDLYARSIGNLDGFGAFRYSPAIGQLMAPLTALPWELYRAVLMLSLAAAALACWRHALAVPPVAMSIFGGNVGVLFPLLIVLAMRRSAAWWAPMLLAKVFPGVGLLWYVARREWQPLALALGVTTILAVASFVIYPRAWIEWVAMLTTNAQLPVAPWPPLVVRLPAAAALVVWGARRGSAWVLPVAIEIATPRPWIGGPVLLIAIPRLMNAAAAPPAGGRRPMTGPVVGGASA
jgi:hypothetical protein